MRKMSPERRRVVVLAGGLAALSGCTPLLMQNVPHWIRWMWLGLLLALLLCVVGSMIRWRKRSMCR